MTGFEDSTLDKSFSDALPTSPRPESNWGLREQKRPQISFRLLAALVVSAVVLLVLPFLLLALRSDPSPPQDDAYRTLDAYSRTRAAGVDLQEGLAPADLARLSTASRVESGDDSLLALRSDSICWAVPLEPPTPPPAPEPVVDEFCR